MLSGTDACCVQTVSHFRGESAVPYSFFLVCAHNQPISTAATEEREIQTFHQSRFFTIDV